MRKLAIWLVPMITLLVGCGFSGDITPPPSVATTQAHQAQAMPSPTSVVVQPSATSDAARPTEAPSITEASPPAANEGVIQGLVLMGTHGAEIPPALEATLYGFDGQQQMVELTAEVNEDGAFRFKELELVPGRLFVVVVEHQGVVYGSEIVHLTTTEASAEMTVVIHETSLDPSVVNVDRLHLLFDFPAEGFVRVLELWVLSNMSDRTLATEEGVGLLEVALPDDAAGLSFESGVLGERFIQTDRGFIDTAPLPPGEGTSQLVFSFELPYRKRLDFNQQIDYPVAAVVVLIDEDGPKIEGAGLEDRGVRETEEMSLRTYVSGAQNAGEALAFKLSGRPPAGEGSSDADPQLSLVIGVGSLGLMLVGVGLWWYRALSRSEDQDLDEALEDEPLDAAASAAGDERETILQKIATLDDAFEAGDLEKDEYTRLRAELKNRALEILKGDG